MGAQLDLVEHILQLGIGKGIVTARHRRRQLVEGRAGNAACQQAITRRVQQIQQLLDMGLALGAAVGGIV